MPDRKKLRRRIGIPLVWIAAWLSTPSTDCHDQRAGCLVQHGPALSLAFAQSVASNGVPGAIPASFFGIHLGTSQTSLTNPPPWGTPILSPVTVGALGKCVASGWQYVERTPDVYTWSQIDTCTAWAAHFGIRYFQSWEYMTPGSIGAADPAHDSRCWPAAISGIYSCMGVMTADGRQQWIRFNTALAMRYKGNPGLDFYEGWNEPPFGPNSSIQPILASDLAQYERDRVAAIRAVDPDAKFGSPAFVLDAQYPAYAAFVEDFLSSNPPVYDYYDFHEDYQDQPESEISQIAQFRQALARHGITSPVLLATEGGHGGSGQGASTDVCPGWPANVTPELQQAFTARMELIYWSESISRHYWYAYDTCSALTNQPRSNTLTVSGTAYGNVQQWMIGATMGQRCAAESPGSSIWTCVLTRDGGYQGIAVWSRTGTANWIAPAGSVQYRDLTGGVAAITGGASIAIGVKPILVENRSGTVSTTLSLSRTNLKFGYAAGAITGPQTVYVSISGPGLNWTASSSQPNITVSPASGSAGGPIQITASPGAGGVVTINAPGAANPQQQIQVDIASVAPSLPFGSFDTPQDNAQGISGAIAVTGWALDAIEVTKVDLWRERVGGEPVAGNGLVYIGDAIFVAGARPDVESMFPASPFGYRAGWGYLLLTNSLPNPGGAPGNGAYKLHAIAHNKTGGSAELGVRTITADNLHATKPFGTIDTPDQGGTVSGTQFVNFGWTLAQGSNCIPKDGSTITVTVDGVPLGHPTYNQFRADLVAAFPGRCNSAGSAGYFILDTTKLSNGVHTIGWLVFDDHGNGEGLGSRFFNVFNSAPATATGTSDPGGAQRP